MLRTSNPALSEKRFQIASVSEEKMTLDGTVNKSFILIALVIVTAFFSWKTALQSNISGSAYPGLPAWYIPMLIGAFIVGTITIFKQNWAPFLAPLYAVLEGFALGAISAGFEVRYPGIVAQATLCTCTTFVSLLLAYKSRLIQASQNFRLGVAAATGGIGLFYLAGMFLPLFGHQLPLIHESGVRGILFTGFVVVIAALNLVLDFDFIEQGAEKGSPKYMEWYSAFGLLVTLVWLYVEFLRLLSKTRKK